MMTPATTPDEKHGLLHVDQLSPIHSARLFRQKVITVKKLSGEVTGALRTPNTSVYLAKTENENDSYKLGVPHQFTIKVYNKHNNDEEPRVHAGLNHPNVVRCYGAWVELTGNVLCIALEYCNNKDLRQHMRSQYMCSQDRCLPNNVVVRIATDVLRGLEYLHNVGVVHGNIKPGNVFVDKPTSMYADMSDCNFLLGDFSKAQYVNGASNANGPLAGDDIFSFGVMLYELLSDQRVSRRENTWSELEECVKERRYDAWLITLCAACLCDDPDQRPTASRLLAAVGDEEGCEMLQRAIPGPSSAQLDARHRAYHVADPTGSLDIPTVSGSSPASSTAVCPAMLAGRSCTNSSPPHRQKYSHPTVEDDPLFFAMGRAESDAQRKGAADERGQPWCCCFFPCLRR